MSVYGHVYRVPPPLLQPQARRPPLTPIKVLFAVTIGGVDRTLQVVKRTVELTFVLTQQPSTARMQVYGFTPTVGQIINVISGGLVFAGTITRVIQHSTKHALGKVSYLSYDIECTDWTWLLNRRRVTKTYPSGTGASTIILDIISTFTSGFTTGNVTAGAPTINADLVMRGQLVSTSLQQVCDAVGWAFWVDETRDVHFYSTASTPSTTSYAVATSGTSFVVPADVTQVVTKAWGGGGGGDGTGRPGGGGGYASGAVAVIPGETLTVRVGGGGAKDANSWQGGGGGGYSGLFRGTTPLIVAGGGGGASNVGSGGPGGGLTGLDGTGSTTSAPGLGGTASAGGAAGMAASPSAVAPTAGAALTGGSGGGYTTGAGDAGAAGGTNGGGAGGAKGTSGVTVSLSYLVVAGGGGGAEYVGGGAFAWGGGGGGGVKEGTAALAVGSYAVTVGAGGLSGRNGNDSALGTVATARGGGYGSNGDYGIDGGSGGGAGAYREAVVAGGAGTAGQGYAGGKSFLTSTPNGAPGGGGGGGGAGSAGGGASASGGGAGGSGYTSSISGVSVTYAAGAPGTGNPSDGADPRVGNPGEGGTNYLSGKNGIVIVRYATGVYTATGGTITTGGGYTYHTFTSSGTFTITAIAVNTATGGGGGGGYYGGGGGVAGDAVGGGGGGSSYVSGTLTTTQTGSGASAGNTSDADYAGSAGAGGVNASGTAGLVVLKYAPSAITPAPDPLIATNMQYSGLEYQLDLTQVRTRITVIGGGTQTTAPVAAGATSISVEDCSWFAGTGGTVLARNQIITYTGTSAASGPGNLTGVPAAGTGCINTALLQGDEVQVYVQRNDAAAQTALAALEGGDGIHEDWIEDSLWTIAAATVKADAALLKFKNTDVRGSYQTYDTKTHVGASVAILLPSRGIATSVTLQRVTQTHVSPDRWSYQCEFAVVWSDVVDLLIGVVSSSAATRK